MIALDTTVNAAGLRTAGTGLHAHPRTKKLVQTEVYQNVFWSRCSNFNLLNSNEKSTVAAIKKKQKRFAIRKQQPA
jgi:hypothetical protein